MKIYTKTGDKGQSSLFSGTRVSKCHPRLKSYGCVDELNTSVGLLRSQLSLSQPILTSPQENLRNIQNTLFNLGSYLACDKETLRKKMPPFSEALTLNLEKQIDFLDKDLDPLGEFILPTGHITAALAHQCRTLCRHTERTLIEEISSKEEPLFLNFITYLNRLSDYFFVLARWFNHHFKVKEEPWKKEF